MGNSRSGSAGNSLKTMFHCRARQLSRKAILVMALFTTGLPLAAAQQENASDDEVLREVVVIGTRRVDRVAIESTVPVDVITATDLAVGGPTNIHDQLAGVLPSFNAPKVVGTAHSVLAPAFSLRGLAPDQTLVLVNGRRRHPTSMVNLSSVHRGSVTVDLNAIPSAAIKRVEVLRDGASAQYGSDAIAGVINLEMDDANDGLSFEAVAGRFDTTMDGTPGGDGVVTDDNGNPVARPGSTNRLALISNGDIRRKDGESLTTSVKWGLPIGGNGFLNLTGEFVSNAYANRSGPDDGQTYARLPNGQFDPREATTNRDRQARGRPESHSYTGFLNSGYTLSGGTRLYAFGSVQDRNTVTGGVYREAWDEGRTVLDVYPDGFTPRIEADMTDFSLAFGARGDIAAWNWDVSFVRGFNEIAFLNSNTINLSLGSDSPTEFDGGSQSHAQNTVNLDLQRLIDLDFSPRPLSVAFGVELREERYRISRGDAAATTAMFLRDANGNLVLDANGNRQLAGIPYAQGSLFFQPDDEQNASRDAFGAYAEVDGYIGERWNLVLAGRYEDYSDFGTSLTGKVATRFALSDSLAFRGAFSTGFRAPSLQQQFYKQTNTTFIQGERIDIVALPATDPVSVALGAGQLEAEKATSASLGLTWTPNESLNVTLDAYQIDVDDRIVLTDQLNAQAVLEQAGFFGVAAARMFINGLNSRTRGVDLAVTYVTDLGPGALRVTATANWNSTEVSDILPTVALTEHFSPSEILTRSSLRGMENGAPEYKGILSNTWTNGGFGATLRATLYGESTQPANVQAGDRTVDTAVILDAELRYKFSERVSAAIGGNNLLDDYPASSFELFGDSATQAALYSPYPGFSPYGALGRFLYVKLGVAF